jgi:hypothetical protein
MIVTDTHPRLDVVDSGDSIRLWLNNEHSVLLSTPLQAHELADALRRAAHHLEERARLVAERTVRAAASVQNLENEPEHKEWGSTLQLAKQVVIEACTCNRFFVCDRHVQGGAA